MKDVFVSICSGLIGVLLTIGYQHFLAPEQPIIVNIDGKEVEVTSTNYEELSAQNETLKVENTKLNNDLVKANEKLSELQKDDLSSINYSDVFLFVDGENIPINSNNSLIEINGREYYSKELAESFLSEDQHITIKDNNLYIGKITYEQSNLTDQWMIDSEFCNIEDSVTDSYGNIHTNCIVLGNYIYHTANVKYAINEKYNKFKADLSISSDSGDYTGEIIIKTDNNLIYKYDNLTKDTQCIPIDVTISGCKNLSIEYSGNQSFYCILSNAVVYNE